MVTLFECCALVSYFYFDLLCAYHAKAVQNGHIRGANRSSCIGKSRGNPILQGLCCMQCIAWLASEGESPTRNSL